MFNERILAISDVHGHYEELMMLLEKVDYNPHKDKLILLGDYIDRGKKSYEVIQMLKELQRKGAIILRGNHEEILIRISARDYTAIPKWLIGGGIKTLKSYKKQSKSFFDDIEFLKSLPLFHEEEEYIFVHAGLKPGEALVNQKKKNMLWIRLRFLLKEYKGNKKIVFGHSCFKEPLIREDKIGIDTGVCFRNKKLTCLELPSENIYQVDKFEESPKKIFKHFRLNKA